MRVVPPNFAAIYERLLVPAIFRPWANGLLDRTLPMPQERVLDLACGTGIVARLLCERRGSAANIKAVDANPEMIAVARSIAPEIDWRVGNALELPFAPASFEWVLCQQALQFFSDRGAALQQIHRVLVQGGRLALSTWRPLEDNPLFHHLHILAASRFGPHVDRRFSFGDGDAIATLFAAAGFREIRTEIVTKIERMPDPDTFVAMNLGATVSRLDELGEDERNEVVGRFQAEARPVIAEFLEGKELVHQVSATIVTAVA
jgi:ubiquinone/menaquinone biosynthesis C-methylase UbiE